MKALELIRLYFYFCECYNTELSHQLQRFSPNSTPKNEKLTAIELLTIYFYCRRYENKHLKTEIYDYANRYLRSWFPALTAYANFNSRINALCSALPTLITLLLEKVDYQTVNMHQSLIDSLPIMLCSGKRQGKVARELSDKTFCASKGIYYWGIKLHLVAFSKPHALPIPEFVSLTPASENDLTAFRAIADKLIHRDIFADKAYCDKELQDITLPKQDIRLYTPVKLVKGESTEIRQFDKAANNLFSRAVSAVRQPIESFFNWIMEKTKIQNASKVRATKGLLTHTFGSFATALFFWVF